MSRILQAELLDILFNFGGFSAKEYTTLSNCICGSWENVVDPYNTVIKIINNRYFSRHTLSAGHCCEQSQNKETQLHC